HVCVTGGEPLAQPRCLDLLVRLCDLGYRVSLETSGAIDLDGVDARVVKVMDLKTPGSGEVERNLWRNLDLLNPHDQIKLVLRDRRDYEWARFMLDQHRLPERVEAVLFSPCQGELDPARLAQWMLDDRLPVRFQLQLHKVLWGDQPGR
ncbi:MAG TPA: 7-carboxy-7-deazaguanine synthase QueE, partial [Pseudomonadales bacterium]|nr:7-carboxy-7-deazaguanine synthase QueE [Pseudomonadales bacterium]